MEMVLQQASQQYKQLCSVYQELICNPENKLADLDYLEIGPNPAEDVLRLEFFGRVAEVRFSMVINNRTPLGQATFTLIKDEDSPRRIERDIWSIWFDVHGRAHFEVEERFHYSLVKNNGTLIHLVEEAVKALIQSGEFKPAVNPTPDPS